MIISGHMNYFSVTECGLYRYNSGVEYGLDMAETFDAITKWAAGKTMSATMPWDLSQRHGPKCYLHDVYVCPDTGDYLIVLWKSDTDNGGSIWGAQEDQPTGSGKVIEYSKTYRGSKVIWGRPCYYWIIPSLDTVVSVKFDHSVSDSKLFQEWVTSVITNHVKHPNKQKEQTDQGHVRLHFTDGSQDPLIRFRYGFNMGLMSLDSSGGTLTELASKITHIIKRETITVEVQDEREEWLRYFDKVPYLKPKPKSAKRQIEIKAEAQPTAKEVKEIIEQFAQENRRTGAWENIGFGTKDHVYWVDQYRLKSTVEYNHTKGVIPAVELFLRLAKDRSKFLSSVIKNHKATAIGSGAPSKMQTK